MPKKLADVTVRVTIDIQIPRYRASDPVEKQESYLLACAKECDTLIKRHVRPHMQEEIFVGMDIERVFTCSSCGYNWGEKSDTFNGGCCDEDMKNDPDAPAQEGQLGPLTNPQVAAEG